MTLTSSERVILKDYRQSRKGYHMVGSEPFEYHIFLRRYSYIYVSCRRRRLTPATPTIRNANSSVALVLALVFLIPQQDDSTISTANTAFIIRIANAIPILYISSVFFLYRGNVLILGPHRISTIYTCICLHFVLYI